MSRNAKPLSLKLLEGNPGKRKLNIDQPRSNALTSTSEPPMSLGLSKKARRIWRELLDTLPKGLILESDAMEYGRYCELISDRAEIRKAISIKGRTILVLDEQGNPRSEKSRPEVSALFKTESELRLLGTLLGMSPSARERVSISHSSEPDNELDRQLFG